MKRKPPAVNEPVISPEIISSEIMEEAIRSLDLDKASDKIKPMAKCFVCGSEATPNPTEQLCWVCRRLKISAWRDVEAQIPAQE
jgi:hypothetical protein